MKLSPLFLQHPDVLKERIMDGETPGGTEMIKLLPLYEILDCSEVNAFENS